MLIKGLDSGLYWTHDKAVLIILSAISLSLSSIPQTIINYKFIKKEIICRYGFLERIISNNASNLKNKMMEKVCAQFKIQHHNLAPYLPKMNGAVKTANKNIKKIIEKTIDTYKD